MSLRAFITLALVQALLIPSAVAAAAVLDDSACQCRGDSCCLHHRGGGPSEHTAHHAAPPRRAQKPTVPPCHAAAARHEAPPPMPALTLPWRCGGKQAPAAFSAPHETRAGVGTNTRASLLPPCGSAREQMLPAARSFQLEPPTPPPRSV